MAAIPDTVAQSVKFFLEAVQQYRRIEAAYIYGSQARNGATRPVSRLSAKFNEPEYK